jgi:hypothetical protein
MSVASGIAPGAGAASSAGSFCPRTAPGARPAGGHVGFGAGPGGSTPPRSSTVSPGGAGTVCAHVGVGFCIGTACFGSDESSGSAGGSVLVQSGRVSLIGLAATGSPSEAVSLMDGVPLSLKGGATGTVRAQTGVVSCVGTAVTGGSGVDSCGFFSGSGSTSIVQV